MQENQWTSKSNGGIRKIKENLWNTQGKTSQNEKQKNKIKPKKQIKSGPKRFLYFFVVMNCMIQHLLDVRVSGGPWLTSLVWTMLIWPCHDLGNLLVGQIPSGCHAFIAYQGEAIQCAISRGAGTICLGHRLERGTTGSLDDPGWATRNHQDWLFGMETHVASWSRLSAVPGFGSWFSYTAAVQSDRLSNPRKHSRQSFRHGGCRNGPVHVHGAPSLSEHPSLWTDALGGPDDVKNELLPWMFERSTVNTHAWNWGLKTKGKGAYCI